MATLHVYGYRNQINWSDWRFVQLPAPGDLISVKDREGEQHFAKVRYTTYVGASVHREDEQPTASVIADWADPESFL